MVAVWAAGHEDLLVADMAFGSDGAQEQLDHAEREITAHLGRFYQLPLAALDASDEDFLRVIHAEKATGYLMVSRGGTDPDTLAYGKWLLDHACKKLDKIGVEFDLRGQMAAENDTPTSTTGDFQPAYPSVINVFDNQDLMKCFEDNHLGQTSWRG